jgi:endonuclease III
MRSWVDTHVWRISIRLGLIGKKLTADDAHNLLQALLPQDARTIYNFHKGVCCGMVNISASMTDRTVRSVS